MSNWKLVPVEPVAWMVKNGFVCSMIYRSKKDADNYAADQQKRHDLSGSLASFCVIPLYAAPLVMKLSDERIYQVWGEQAEKTIGKSHSEFLVSFVRAIEREILGG